MNEMNESEQLGALYAVAQEQQAAVGSAVQALQQQAKAIAGAVQNLDAATQAAKAQPAAIDKAVREVAGKAIHEALSASRNTAIGDARETAENAAKAFYGYARDASKVARDAAESISTASAHVAVWMLVSVFLLGLALGAGGLYLLHTPKTGDIYLDTNKIAQQMVAACRKR